MRTTSLLFATSLLCASPALAQEPELPKLPRGALPTADSDGDGLPDNVDPEPFLSNLAERFVYRIESPTLTWQLDQEQFTLVEKSSEKLESEIESARQAAQDVLEESTREAELFVDEKVQPEPGWFQLSVNPLAVLGGMFSGIGALDALASGVKVDGGDANQREEKSRETSILKRVAREESRTREVIAERRTRLLQIQRYTRILRNPKLQVSLHLRNGGTAPLVVERPEVPVLAGARMLGVATPVDPRDRDRVVIPAGRAQAILLSVPVDDTEFWEALTEGAEAIRYEPLLGAMRAHFLDDAATDLLSLVREQPSHCVPARIQLPEGAAVEQAVARTAADGKPTTAREVVAAWNQAWRRQHPDAGGDLIRVDALGQVVSAAGPTGSALGSGWQLVVDGVPLPIDAPADVPVTKSLEVQWTSLAPLFQALARKTGLADPEQSKQASAWVLGGLTAWEQYRKLRQGAEPAEVIASIRTQLGGTLGQVVPDEYRGSLLATLGEAHRLAGSLQEARANWQQAAKFGDPQAILALANQLLDLPSSVGEGVKRLRQAAAAGSAEAMVRLADVEQQPGGNPRRGMLLIGQAAEAGHAPALTALAQRYESGDGLPRDIAQAAALYRRAAGEGDCAAMLRLGMLYETGQGVPQDAARASAWYRAAASGKAFEEDAR